MQGAPHPCKEMILALLTLITAIAISAIAAYFSIAGLVAIFAATPIPIAIMGSFLEAAKLVTASWVYRNWNTAPKAIKWYLTGSVVVLSLITSMGIFGYLSKSHIQQTTVVGTNSVELSIIEQQEKILKSRIDFLVAQSEKTPNASTRISRELQDTQRQLKEIIDRKAPLLQSKNQLEAELGPLKYITEFIYGKSNEELINKAVRWVIVTLIFVFDPLAILLLISANISLNQATPVTVKKKKPKKSFAIIPGDVRINKSKIHEIPREILDKVFKK